MSGTAAVSSYLEQLKEHYENPNTSETQKTIALGFLALIESNEAPLLTTLADFDPDSVELPENIHETNPLDE